MPDAPTAVTAGEAPADASHPTQAPASEPAAPVQSTENARPNRLDPEARRQWIRDALDRQPAAPAPEAPAEPAAPATESPPAPEDPGTDLSQTPPAEAPVQANEEQKERWPKDAIERIRRLKDQKAKAKTEAETQARAVAELQATVEDLQRKLAETQAPPPASGIERLDSEDAVHQRIALADQIEEWVDERLDEVRADPVAAAEQLRPYGIEVPPDLDWTDPDVARPMVKAMAERLKDLRRRARNERRLGRDRIEWLKRESEQLARIQREIPELAEPDGKLSQAVNEVLTRFPGLKAEPNWAELAVVGALGFRELARMRETQAAPAAAPEPRPVIPRAPRVPGASRAAVPASGAVDPIDAMRAQALRRGASREDREAYIRAQLDAPQKRT